MRERVGSITKNHGRIFTSPLYPNIAATMKWDCNEAVIQNSVLNLVVYCCSDCAFLINRRMISMREQAGRWGIRTKPLSLYVRWHCCCDWPGAMYSAIKLQRIPLRAWIYKRGSQLYRTWSTSSEQWSFVDVGNNMLQVMIALFLAEMISVRKGKAVRFVEARNATLHGDLWEQSLVHQSVFLARLLPGAVAENDWHSGQSAGGSAGRAMLRLSSIHL